MKDERLEQLSDKVRSGIPVSFTEAIEVIIYQESIKKPKKVSLWQKLKTAVSPGAHVSPNNLLVNSHIIGYVLYTVLSNVII